MEDSLASALFALHSDPRVASVEFVTFDYGGKIGLRMKLHDGTSQGCRVVHADESMDNALLQCLRVLKGWLDNG